MKNYITYSAILVLSVLFFACSKNDTSAPSAQAIECDGTVSTFNSNIKSIIDNNCTNSSCHPAFTNYASIKPYLTNGSFTDQVLTNRTMPRTGSLSNNELTKIKCWADAGFPER